MGIGEAFPWGCAVALSRSFRFGSAVVRGGCLANSAAEYHSFGRGKGLQAQFKDGKVGRVIMWNSLPFPLGIGTRTHRTPR